MRKGDDLTTLLCRVSRNLGTLTSQTALGLHGLLRDSFYLFTPFESQVVMVCQDIVDSPDEGVRTDAIIIDFSKAFDLVPHYRLLTKIAATGVDLRVVIW